MNLPILHSHFVTALCMSPGDKEETVVHCLTTNNEVQYERGEGPGDMYAMVPEQEGDQEIAEEIALRCNEHPVLMKLLREALLSSGRYESDKYIDLFLRDNKIKTPTR